MPRRGFKRIRAFLALVLLSCSAAVAQPWRGSAAIGVQVSGKGGALGGARVTLTYRESSIEMGPSPVLTDERGRAAIVGLASGSWNVEIRHPEHLTWVAAVTLEPRRKATIDASFLQATGEGRESIRVKVFKADAAIGSVAGPPPDSSAAERPPEAETKAAAAEASPAPSPARRPEAPEPSAPPARRPSTVTPAPDPVQEPLARSEPAPLAEQETEPEPQPDQEPEPETRPEPEPTPEPEPEESPSAPREVPATPPGGAAEAPAPDTPAAAAEDSAPAAQAPAHAAEVPAPAAELPTPAAELPALDREPERPAAEAQALHIETPSAPVEAPVSAPLRPAPAPRSFRDRSCVECKPGEWAVASEVAVAPGSGCPAAPSADLADAFDDLAASRALAGFAGPALGPFERSAATVAGPTIADRMTAAAGAEADGSNGCAVLAVALPAGSRFVGFRFEAEDAGGGGDCLAGQDCPVGEATWPDVPRIARGAGATLIWARFVNRSETRVRRARLTAYFVPERASWRPGNGG